MSQPLAAAAALGLAVALVLGAVTAPVVLVVAVVMTQGLLVAGWHRSLDWLGATGGAVVAGAAALGADLVVLAADGDRPLSGVPAVLALSVLAALVHQLLRRDGRGRLVHSLAATVALAALAVLASSYLAAEAADGGAALVAVAALPAGTVVAASVLRRRTGRPQWLDLAAVPAAAVLALAVPLLSDLAVVPGLVIAAAAALVAWVAGFVVTRSAEPDPALAAGLPLALAGPVAYVLGRLLVG
jgi:hypothetical protein